MVVVPSFAHCQQPDPPHIDAVVFGGEVFVTQFWNVAYDVEHQWNLKNCGTGEGTSSKCHPSERYKQYDSEGNADGKRQQMCSVPNTILFQESINRILR